MFDLKSLVKYLLEGLAVAVVAFYLPKKTSLKEVALIALTASVVFAVLDMFAPSIALSARQGSGFGIGMNMVGGDSDEDKLNAVKNVVCESNSESDSDSESDSESDSDSEEMTGGSAELVNQETEATAESESVIPNEPQGVSFCDYSPAPIGQSLESNM